MPSKKRYDVVIIGAGFSGCVAASRLSGHGLDVLLIEENIHIGGQLLRRIPDVLGTDPAPAKDFAKRVGFEYVDKVRSGKVEVSRQTRVLGIYAKHELLIEHNEQEVCAITFDYLIFATGARERFLPFKGWTLPGIYSTGMIQVLSKSSGILPAEKMLISGSGLFLLAAAYEVLKNGGKVSGIFELSGLGDKLKLLPLFPFQSSKYLEGAKFFLKILTSGVPLRFRRRVIEARGSGSLEEVVSARVNSTGSVIPGTERTERTHALAMGFGFVPNIELPLLADCALEFSDAKGGWVVSVQPNMETSIENIFAAGEITGVAGALKSINEGHIAAASILHKTGKTPEATFRQEMERLSRERKHHLKFGELFNLLYRLPPEVYDTVPDETILCRCEDVTMGELRRAVRNGYHTPGALKIAVRTGMGNCQGRTCGPMVIDIMARISGKQKREIGTLTTRPPIKPVSMNTLATFCDET